MTKTIAIDSDNDIAIIRGNILLVKDLQAVMMLCKHAAQTMLGEMFLAIDEGLPNFELLWNGAPRLMLWQNELRESLSSIQDVIGVNDITIEIIEKTLHYTAEIKTIYGTGEIGNMIYGI
ncbi:MAG: hypothetical protein DU430_09165 [Candidatus Tokpelaia sp.]|nr:MAG: hypothetical protein DU430_09165 [Candidatus Tokpelaia sp.]